MSAPANSIHRVSFWTLAGVATAELVGEEVIGRFVDEPKHFRERGNRRLFEDYANWPNSGEEVLRFTKAYGPLQESARPHGDFRFPLRRWRVSQRGIQVYWENPNPQASMAFFTSVAGDRGWDYERGIGLRYRAANLWEFVHLTLMACPKGRLKKCARPECQHPYFVAQHLGQTYCSEPCSRWAQQQWKKRWWHEHGKKRRDRERSKRSRNPRTRKF
jgi:hypothetical protein